MANEMDTRKRMFESALKLDGLTAGAWAEANDVSMEHLSLVLNARRAGSKEFLAKIDAYADATHRKHWKRYTTSGLAKAG